MKSISNKTVTGYVASLMILLGANNPVQAEEFDSAQLAALKTFDGQTLLLDKNKLTHLVFQDVWSSYEGQGEEARVGLLPKRFTTKSQQVWVQPGINVTAAQLTEYQGYFPQVKPLVLDRGFHLMRSLNAWEMPLHVILNDGKKVFSGNGSELDALAKNHFSSDLVLNQWLAEAAKNLVKQPLIPVEKKAAPFSVAETTISRYHKPVKGDKAPLFTVETLAGKTVSLMGLSYNKPLSLVFVDSLCPMPHFPGCEAKLNALNDLVASDTSREWLGVVSSYYVNEEIAQGFRDKFQLKLPLIFDTDNQIYQSYGVHASPYQIDISREGNIRSRGAELH